MKKIMALVILAFVFFTGCAVGGDAGSSGGGGGGGNNNSPFVYISTPDDGDSVLAGTTISITAIATDNNGRVVKTEILFGETVLCGNTVEKKQVTLTCNWLPTTRGKIVLKAKALNDNGAEAWSEEVIINVMGKPQLGIAITSPIDGTTAEALYSTFVVVSIVSDGDTITKVDIYDGSTVIGTVSVAPFTFAWRNVKAGSHGLSAKVYDIEDHSATSAVNKITVLNPSKNTLTWCYANPSTTARGQAESINPDATSQKDASLAYKNLDLTGKCVTIPGGVDGRIPYIWIDATKVDITSLNQGDSSIWFGADIPPLSIKVNGGNYPVPDYFIWQSGVGGGYPVCLTEDCGLHTGYGQVLLKIFSDADGDGIPNSKDNCMLFANANQADSNHDGIGDACAGLDSDNDGYMDYWDNYPNDPNQH